MASKRDVLETLGRSDLQALVARFDLQPTDRRSRARLIEALMAARKAKLDDVLGGLPAATLRQICSQLEVSASGAKAAMIERIGAAGRRPASAAKSDAKAATAVAKKKVATAPEKKPAAKGSVKAPSAATKKKAAAGDKKPAAKGSVRAPSAATKKKAAAEKKPAAKRSTKAAPAVEKKKPTKRSARAAPVAAKNEKAAADDLPSQGASGAPPLTKLQRSWFANDPPPAEPTSQVVKCAHCRKKITIKQCQVPRCTNWFVPTSQLQVCAECVFERDQLTLMEFNAKLKKESACPECGKPWEKKKRTA